MGVKGNWKELWLSQPAVAACPDPTASALWLNSSRLHLVPFWLRVSVGLYMWLPERRAICRLKKNEAKEYGGEKYQKDISWSFP